MICDYIIDIDNYPFIPNTFFQVLVDTRIYVEDRTITLPKYEYIIHKDSQNTFFAYDIFTSLKPKTPEYYYTL